MALRLIIEDDEGSTTIVPLGDEPVTIGRQEGNTIRLTEQNVSRKHARLHPRTDGWVLEDLGSYNGIKVNGHSIERPVILTEGDVVRIGDYYLALTEDVDRATVNVDRKGMVANDGEPLLASSSTDLPRLSQAELAQIHAEAGTSAAGGPAVASGAIGEGVRAIPVGVGVDAEEPEPPAGTKPVVLIGAALGAVALIAIAVLAFSSDEEPSAPKGVAAAEDAPTPGGAAPAVAPPEDAPVAPAPTPALEPGSEPVGDEPDMEIEEADPAPSPTARRKRRRRRSKAAPAPAPQPEPAPEPAPAPADPPPEAKTKEPPTGDPDQLLKDARKASLTGNPSKAYNLAKQAYAIDKSTAALEVMGVSACKMGSAGKAKSAYGKLSGPKKQSLQKICAAKGKEE